MANFACPVCSGKLNLYKNKDRFFMSCPNCEITAEGASPEEVQTRFNALIAAKADVPAVVPADAVGVPANRDSFLNSIKQNFDSFKECASSFLSRGAVEKLLNSNAKYIVNNKAFDKLWENEDGRQSLIDAFNEALSLAAELPNLGYIIPYGNIATFIPRVEAFRNVLCNGPTAPFKWINIEAVHEKDKVKISRINGNFTVEFENISSFDRGDVKGVVVYGYHKAHECVIGESYEAKRLFDKGTATSSAYHQYKADMAAFNLAVTENKVKKDPDGREYVEQIRKKKNGESWTKKIYKDEITNPYEGPHKEEMLMKVAGKSYLGPFLKERIGSAVIDDMQNIQTDMPETAVERSVAMAESQYDENAIKETNILPKTEQLVEENDSYSEPEVEDDFPFDPTSESNSEGLF